MESKELLDVMIMAGIDEDAAIDFIIQETGENPITLDSAEVRVMVEVTVVLDKYDLDGLTVDDEKDITTLAEMEALNSITGSVDTFIHDVEIVTIETNRF